MRYTVAIKPEAWRRVYWTMVSIDTLVSVGAASTRITAERIDDFFTNLLRTEGKRYSAAGCPILARSVRKGGIPRGPTHRKVRDEWGTLQFLLT